VIHCLTKCMVYLGSALMVYNIFGFVRFARSVRARKLWNGNDRILYIPVILLVIFLLGYLIIGFFGRPDLIVAGILLGGSIFVFVMYWMLSSIMKRILANEETEAKLLAAEEASRAKANFLATMSHEMRTPMNVILGLDELALNNPELSPQTRQQLEKIGQSGRHLLGLINNILEMNNIEANSLELRQEPFRMEDMLDQVNAIVNTVCDEKGLDYHFTLGPDAGGCYAGDMMQLKTVLLHLLNNAVKYTDMPGDVRFSVERDGTEGEKARLRFTVSDTGVGIDKEFLPRIFEPFAQEDSSTTNRYGGTGLSLTVTKNIVERMGGAITVKSKKGCGSTFVVELPLPTAVCDETPAAAEEEISLAGRRILLAEDIPENAEIVMDILELEDVETVHAENGQIALDLFRESAENYYDVVLMDLRMPVMDGLEATRRIRALSRRDAKTVPIIALTANAYESDIKASLEAGMNAHLAKPADADMLYATIKQWIKSSCAVNHTAAHKSQ